MTNAMAAFGIAVAGTSLVCYALMTRVQNSARNRRSSGDSSTDVGSSIGGDGWTVASWLGTVRATRAISAAAISAAAIAGEAATAGVAAAADTVASPKDQDFDLPQQRFLDSIQSVSVGSLELLEKTVFPFASRRGLKYP
jgi:hypothetical protein